MRFPLATSTGKGDMGRWGGVDRWRICVVGEVPKEAGLQLNSRRLAQMLF